MSLIKEKLLKKGYRLFKILDDDGIIIKNKDGYLYETTLPKIMKSKRSLKLTDRYGRFSLKNIEQFLKVNNLSFELCDGNVFLDDYNYDLQFYCHKCDEYFYSCFAKIVENYQSCCECGFHYLLDKRYELRSEHRYLWKYEDNNEYNNEIDWDNLIWKDQSFESEIATELKKYCVERYNAIPEYEECINPKTKFPLPYDIYIPQYKLYIEVQGSQHKEFTEFFHASEKSFEYQKYKDKIKKEHAVKNGDFVEINLGNVFDVERAIEIVEHKINEIVYEYE